MEPKARKRATRPLEEEVSGDRMRLNRFLARAGIASRRKSDALIKSGAVQVNGCVVQEPGCCIVVGRDRIEVERREVALPDTFQYILMHKPAGCLVSHRDPHGRPTVFDQIEGLRPGTVAVGRLDLDTTGLLLLMDDGELAFRLMHPRFGVEKCYEALVKGCPSAANLDRLRHGIVLEDGMTAPARVQVQEQQRGRYAMETRLEIRLHEGRKRQVRRMCAAIGHRVKALARVAFAGLELDRLEPGQWRDLAPGEVQELRSQVGLSPRD